MIEKFDRVFLDFDGVICNSVIECWFVSYVVYYFDNNLDEAIGKVPLSGENMEKFISMRPLIRTGEDFIVLQKAIDSGTELLSQDDFDNFKKKYVSSLPKDNLKEKYYEVRKNFLENFKEKWNSLNPLFDGLVEVLKKISKNENVFILSTKEVPYLKAILEFNGINWSENRLLCSGKSEKYEFINKFTKEGQSSVLIEDQVDHLKKLPTHIKGYLATWGYIKKEWLNYPLLINLKEFIEFLNAY